MNASLSLRNSPLDAIMHNPRLRDPLTIATAILDIDGTSGPYVFRFREDPLWDCRSFRFESLRVARAFALCIECYWILKTPAMRCEVVGPHGELYAAQYAEDGAEDFVEWPAARMPELVM